MAKKGGGSNGKPCNRQFASGPDDRVSIDRIAVLVGSLESGIKDLKSVSPTPCERHHIELLIHMYEWALAEIEDVLDGSPMSDADRVAALCRLLNMPLGQMEFDGC